MHQCLEKPHSKKKLARFHINKNLKALNWCDSFVCKPNFCVLGLGGELSTQLLIILLLPHLSNDKYTPGRSALFLKGAGALKQPIYLLSWL